MKVLHINQSDMVGGAGIAGYRLHQGLLNQGVDSKLLVGIAKIADQRIAAIPRKFRIESQIYRFTRRVGLNHLHLVSSFDIPKHQFYQDADIINFHNLHNTYFNYLVIPKLTATKPGIFTLHDMWSFTGQCAYSFDCERWKTGCHKCPCPTTHPSNYFDSTHIEWKLKEWVYSKSNLTIVTLSDWLTDLAKKSILSRFPIHKIPNGIDTISFQPLDPLLCKTVLDIPKNKKVLLFGAESFKYTRKGGDLLLKVLQQLPASLKSETILLTFGNGSEAITSEVGIPSVNLGYISSDRLKSVAYSAADLFIFPTRADNLPLVLQESMACGTPMVSFKVGGVPDLVRHNITGYLAQLEDVEDFRNGIVSLLEDEKLRTTMSKNCRVIAVNEYSLELQAKKYIELYQQVLQSQSLSS
ncbi:glycosyltransferase family 4 protein [Sphaerospermopsis aphanizomenoides BCCUSP55]|uniref:glycosyltransferase family 4 protein n=1 Tax=Sphaerospermopsis aphanizomenoides TaxID=459663 RepID=UPI001903814A|nr:glycosyltransferase family 4 protein [Sphaerospermopsis aphanizomenoides]MBK1987104.1 glycosyltransferase family 4 protein [Sphaerospermopsis aphanizomenoides BCCUSP55]